MSWGTSYKYDGYLSRITVSELNDKLDECNDMIDLAFREMLSYMSMTPPAYAKDCAGNEYPWAEFVSSKAYELRKQYEEYIALRSRIQDCLEAQADNKDNVHDC